MTKLVVVAKDPTAGPQLWLIFTQLESHWQRDWDELGKRILLQTSHYNVMDSLCSENSLESL